MSSLLAIYDLDVHPLSYDFAFFLQAAEIKRQMLGLSNIKACILCPTDIDNQIGVSEAVYEMVNARDRQYLINNLLIPLSSLMRSVKSLNICYDRNLKNYNDADIFDDLLSNPPVAHNEFYKLSQKNPKKVGGFSASIGAKRLIYRFFPSDTFRNKNLITITLRQYAVDPERNTNISAVKEFCDYLKNLNYFVVIIPDTFNNNIKKLDGINAYLFDSAAYSIELRFALYELAELNIFTSGGPGFAATLFNNINYLLFKIYNPKVNLTSEETLNWLGYEMFSKPTYANDFQEWIWKDDTLENFIENFDIMINKIRSSA